MKETNIIDYIINILSDYPSIKYTVKGDAEIEIISNEKDGFNIFLQSSPIEYTLHLGNFHWHYDKTEYETNEMINQILCGLTGLSRVKELSKNGKAYKWILQIQDQENQWQNNGTLGTLTLNIWGKPEIRYLQNHLISKSIFDTIEIDK